MKKFIVLLLFVPIALFGGVIANIIKRAKAAPSAFSIKSYPLPTVGEPPKSDDPQVAEGWKVFTGKGCVFCHGVGAAGGVKNAGAVGGEIPSLLKVAEGYSADELKKKIHEGVKSEAISTEPGVKSPPPLYMPPWENALTAKEYDDVVHYLMSLAPKKAGGDSWE